MSEKALDKQIAGDHYRNMKIQPVEYIEANGIGFTLGNAIKYISRAKNKGGAEDLKKAIHFITMELERVHDIATEFKFTDAASACQPEEQKECVANGGDKKGDSMRLVVGTSCITSDTASSHSAIMDQWNCTYLSFDQVMDGVKSVYPKAACVRLLGNETITGQRGYVIVKEECSYQEFVSLVCDSPETAWCSAISCLTGREHGCYQNELSSRVL